MQNSASWIVIFFTPWEFSWLVMACCWGTMALYVCGLQRGAKPGWGRSTAFLLGVLLMYLVTQTHFDYWSQYMFFVHRGQHLVLHHLAPFLIALSAPGIVLSSGMPASIKRWFAGQVLLRRVLSTVYRFLQQPFLASLLFVGLIAFWLTPAIHFDAMLSEKLYWLMNWSMALDGLLFWWLILADTRDRITPQLSYAIRILLVVVIMLPQIIIGARLAFSKQVLFDVWPVSPLTDQQLGGLITWIPAAMMSVIAGLVLLRRLLHAQVEQTVQETI